METSGRGWKWRKAGARILYRSAACRSTTDMWACGKHGPHVSGPTSPSVRQRSRVRKAGAAAGQVDLAARWAPRDGDGGG